MEELKRVFKQADLDGSGQIGREEFAAALDVKRPGGGDLLDFIAKVPTRPHTAPSQHPLNTLSTHPLNTLSIHPLNTPSKNIVKHKHDFYWTYPTTPSHPSPLTHHHSPITTHPSPLTRHLSLPTSPSPPLPSHLSLPTSPFSPLPLPGGGKGRSERRAGWPRPHVRRHRERRRRPAQLERIRGFFHERR